MIRKTSIQAYQEIESNGLLGHLQWIVYKYIFENGPCSMMQANLDLNRNKYSNGSYTSRFSELKKMELVHEVGHHVCPHTNKTVILWDVTDKLPKKIEKKGKKVWYVLFPRIHDDKALLFKTKQKALEYRLKNDFASQLHEVEEV